MDTNVGKIDRGLRAIGGIVLILLPFVTGFAIWQNPIAMYGAPVAGIVLVLTSVFSFCPIYRIIGIRTCPIPSGDGPDTIAG